MKNVILSALVAVSVLSPAIVAPAQAASLIITTDNGDGMGGHYWRRHHWRDDYRRDYWRRHHDHHCFIKVRKYWRHHHRVIEKVRICDFHRYDRY